MKSQELIALNKEVFDVIKKEMSYIGVMLLAALLIFRIVYFKESFIIVLRAVVSLFWLFLLPGYAIMLYWREKLGFTERIVIGAALSAALTGAISYYIGLAGLNLKYHAILLPALLIVSGIAINYKKL